VNLVCCFVWVWPQRQTFVRKSFTTSNCTSVGQTPDEDMLIRSRGEVIFEAFCGWQTSKNRQKKESRVVAPGFFRQNQNSQTSDRGGFRSARMARASADKMFRSARMREQNETEDPWGGVVFL